MSAPSILFPDGAECPPARGTDEPACFRDLNLDQIVAAITAGREIYDLRPFYHLSLRETGAVLFRQEVMRDLERAPLANDIRIFSESMRVMRECRTQSEKIRNPLQRQRWFLDAAGSYCCAVTRLAADLKHAASPSRGLASIGEYLGNYIATENFVAIREQSARLTAELTAIRYTVLIDGLTVRVSRYEGVPDYGQELQATFARFQQDGGKRYGFEFRDTPDMDHIEAKILDLVAQLYSETFSALTKFVVAHGDFVDPIVARFDREIQFYLAYLDYLAPFKKAGLSFCYPLLDRRTKEVFARDAFDLALADKLRGDDSIPVTNDFQLQGKERMLVVTGPNQGGKTTFARAVGQLHYLAGLGCPVPGREARLFLCDRIFTHFERGEQTENLRGKLEEDLVRVHTILDEANPESLVILNEIFTSTTFRDARDLSKRVAAQVLDRDLLCVWVTFLDELAILGSRTVSMVALVAPDNPAKRTFKIVRRAPDGLAYALAVAKKYRLTQTALRERLGE